MGGGFGQRPRGAGRGEEGLAQPSVVGRLDCGLISENFRGLLGKILREDSGWRVVFLGSSRSFVQNDRKRKIWPVRPADPTTEKSWRRGLLLWSRN